MKIKLQICVLIFILFLGAGAVFADQFPMPPYTEKQGDRPANISGVKYEIGMYESQLSVEEISAFYKKVLPRQGFVFIAENKAGIASGLAFKYPKTGENFSIGINRDTDREITMFLVSRFKGDLVKKDNSSVSAIAKDVAGQDVPGVPRYPGSIRIKSVGLAGLKMVSYKVPVGSSEEILSFYESRMLSSGWKNFTPGSFAKGRVSDIYGQMGLGASKQLVLIKENTMCFIMTISESEYSKGCGSGECVGITDYGTGDSTIVSIGVGQM